MADALNSPFAFPFVSGKLTAIKGVYRYGGGYPTGTYQASNYWVDVAFTPTVGSPTPSPTTVAPLTHRRPNHRPPQRLSPRRLSAPPRRRHCRPVVTLRQPDGGADWYQRVAETDWSGHIPAGRVGGGHRVPGPDQPGQGNGAEFLFRTLRKQQRCLIQSNGMFTFHGSRNRQRVHANRRGRHVGGSRQ